MLSHLQGEPALAIDTESNSLYAYREQVCLIQISIPGFDYLLDPFSLPNLSGLSPLFADPGVLKVLHGAEYDVSVLHRDYGFVLANLFDTMWASRILGWPSHGLAALLKEYYGVVLNKKYQRANWGQRPLPREQLNYARLDTHYLLALHEIQARELDIKGRWPQARHRFGQVLQSRWEERGFDPDGFWRLTGVRDLDDVGRGVLRELFLFRDQRAKSENRPPFKVLGNRALMGLSERRPRDLQSLHHVSGISSRLVRRYGRKLLAVIRRGASKPLSWDKRPRAPRRRDRGGNGRPTPAIQARFEALRLWRNKTAQARGVEPDLILANRILWKVAFRNPQGPEDLVQDGLLARWQAEDFGPEVLEIIRATN
jgi:ribonuclease D